MNFKKFFIQNIMMSFFVTVTLITFIMAIVGIIYEPDVLFGYEAFLSPLLFGGVASVVSMVKYSKYELSLKQALLRNSIQLMLIEVLTLLILYFGGMLKSISITASLGLSILIVYITASLVLWINDKRMANDLNQGLKRLQADLKRK